MPVMLSILAVLFFSLTLLLSAALMFLIEPMFGRMILPLLGGTPAVWNTCMMFYQVVVLLGYLYAHWSIRRFGARRQSLFHLAILSLPWLTGTFQVRVAEAWIPGTEVNPVFGTLLLLSVSIGIPLFVISATAPMLQRWFSTTTYPGAGDPYFLYAASNLGSFAGLLAYPLLVEPNLPVHSQMILTTGGLALLALMTILCAVLLRMRPTVGSASSGNASTEPTRAVNTKTCFPGAASPEKMPELHQQFATEQWRQLGVTQNIWRERMLWILLSAVPSSLLLGTTTYLATDIASFPLLWVIPLALYLLTFVIVFSPWLRWIGGIGVVIQPVILAFFVVHYFDAMRDANLLFLTGLHLTAFFVATLVCHRRLAGMRPAPERLTEYYVMMSLGGLLGGIFNTLIAPVIFRTVIEYPLMVVAAALLRPTIRLWGGGTPPPQSESQLTCDAIAINDATPAASGWFTRAWRAIGRFSGEFTRPGVALWFDFLVPAVLIILFFVLYLPGKCSLESLLNSFPTLVQWFTHRNAAGVITYNAWKTASIGIGLCLFLLACRPVRYGLTFGGLFLAMMIGSLADQAKPIVADQVRTTSRTAFAGRSFFGVMHVTETRTENPDGFRELFGDSEGAENGDPDHRTVEIEHQLLHGSTTHGVQRFYLHADETFPGEYRATPQDNPFDRWYDPENRNRPTSYYAIGGPVGQIVTQYLAENADHIGIVGLGTGTTASLRFNGQKFTYFEIDPMVERIARDPKLFTYLSDNFPNDEGLEIRIGDARVELTKVPDDSFDLLVIDAFSSDAIPIHLLTREAVQLQLEKIKPDGLLMIHISNRHLELASVVGNIARALGVRSLCQSYSPTSDEAAEGAYSSQYVVLARDSERLEPISWRYGWHEIPEDTDVGVWTDDYSNILSVMTVFRELKEKWNAPAMQDSPSDDNDHSNDAEVWD